MSSESYEYFFCLSFFICYFDLLNCEYSCFLIVYYNILLLFKFLHIMQAVFSPSVLAEIIRPDGSSTISVLSGESLSAELAYELMSIQVTSRILVVYQVLLLFGDAKAHF